MSESQVIEVSSQVPAALAIEFGKFRRPEEVADEAHHVARVFQHQMNTLMDAKREPILFKMFGPSRHITRPGWQLLGAMYRTTAGIVKTEHVTFGDVEGFKATAEAIYVPTGKRISIADAMCLTDEDNWNERPDYEWSEKDKKRVPTGEYTRVPLMQLMSMAETRACSKVLSNLLSFVAVMAGCSGTSAEDMTGAPLVNGKGEPAATAAPRKATGDTITEPQVKRLFGLARNAGKSREALGVILAAHGYTAPATDADPVESAAWLVKKGDFDKIQEAIQKP